MRPLSAFAKTIASLLIGSWFTMNTTDDFRRIRVKTPVDVAGEGATEIAEKRVLGPTFNLEISDFGVIEFIGHGPQRLPYQANQPWGVLCVRRPALHEKRRP
jgi:hypothetical protein